jgi:hypothetical protein
MRGGGGGGAAMSSSSLLSRQVMTDTPSLLEPLRGTGAAAGAAAAAGSVPENSSKPPREGDVSNPIVLPVVVGDGEQTSRVLILPRDPVTKNEPFSVGAQQDL